MRLLTARITRITRTVAVLGICASVVGLTASAPEDGVYYHNDFERVCDIGYYGSACKVKVDELGLCAQDPNSGQRCVKISYHVLEGNGWCYFRIPISEKVNPAAAYSLEASLKVEATGSVRAGFGHSWVNKPPGQREVHGNNPSAGLCPKLGAWCHLASGDIGQYYRDMAVSLGFAADCPGRFDALYVHTNGNQAGDRVTIWLDDVLFREATDGDRARWKQERRALDYIPPPYPAVEDSCPWGCGGSLEGYADRLRLPLDVEAEFTARTWSDLGFDTALRPAGIVKAPGDPGREDLLGRLLDIHQRYGLRFIPSTYLTNYYNRNVSRTQCEAAIKRVVTRFRDHPALLAWWMIDEPSPAVDDIRDQWVWGKRQFEALDPRHPALGAMDIPEAVRAYTPYIQIAIVACYPLWVSLPGSADAVAYWSELAWRSGARRLWAMPQAFGEMNNWHLPTRPELRLMSYLYLSRGASGFIAYYYTMEPAWLTGRGHNGLVDLYGTPTHLGVEMADLADTLMPLSPLLLPLRWQDGSQAQAWAVCDPGPQGKPVLDVSFLAGDVGPKAYDMVIVCNRDVDAQRTGKLFVRQRPGRALYDLRRLQPVSTQADGAVSLSLRPGDAAVLMSGTSRAFVAARATLLARRLQLRQRQLGGLTREALGNGVSPKLWQAALVRVDAYAKAGNSYSSALTLVGQTRQQVAQALLKVPGRQDCGHQCNLATLALSRASRALEVWTLKRWPEAKRAGKVAQMRADEPALGACIDTMAALARCQHLLRYALLTGKAQAHAAAYADLAALADQAEAGVGLFVAGRGVMAVDGAQLERLVAAVRDLEQLASYAARPSALLSGSAPAATP
jgi:hypothetical protein